MCFELREDIIEELAMGRLPGTREHKHLDECRECQERVRRCREWVTMLRQVLGENRRGATTRTQIETIQLEEQKNAAAFRNARPLEIYPVIHHIGRPSGNRG